MMTAHTHRRTSCSETGFSMIELMVVVLIIGILVAIAVPVYANTKANSQRNVCFANERVIEGQAQTWRANYGDDLADLEGVVTGGHPLVGPYILAKPPVCPTAPQPADVMTVDLAHGAYELDDGGTVLPCGFGSPAHAHYND